MRIAPLEPPFDPDAEAQLRAMMPPGVAPLALFRTFARNLPMTAAMHPLGKYLLGRELSLSMRDREIVIDRTCARCNCEYEWGVHVMYFADRVGLDEAQLRSLAAGTAQDECWNTRERLLIEVVDALHTGATVPDGLSDRCEEALRTEEMLDLLLLCGWYHAIAFVANAARVERESGAPPLRGSG